MSFSRATAMNTKSEQFEHWIRHDFKEINTQLEERYFAQQRRENTAGIGLELKNDLLNQGSDFIVQLLREGNTDEGFDAGFDLLGNVGFFMAACRRHGLSDPEVDLQSPHNEASALAMQLGASLGVVPRFASAHQETHNLAIAGKYKTFTNLEDEALFLEYNTRGVFSFIHASRSLIDILPIGISHPVTADLLLNAKHALQKVLKSNAALYNKLNIDRFFYSIRPYFKTHHVGKNIYRGANAGDFAGINVIDLLLGLCRADDAYYSQILVDKFLYMRPDDQLILRDCMRRKSLLDEFIEVEAQHHSQDWFQQNLALFLEVAELHGKIAYQHHDMLVEKFINQPSKDAELTNKSDLTASGPPLPELLQSLQRLADLRNAADSPGIGSRHSDFENLRKLLFSR